MTPDQINLIKESFTDVEPISEYVAKLFYQRLFELDAGLKSMFISDMAELGRKLIDFLALVVDKIDDLGEIVPNIEALGIRHVDYGVKPENYDTVGVALLWTLEQGLDRAFTPEVREAWSSAYCMLADTMISASENVEQQASSLRV
jgi:nitric oxide dioxygenase